MIRKFRLINGEGMSWDLNARTSFFHSIGGFGYQDGTQYEQIGTDFIPLEELFSQGVMTGRIFFGGINAYQNYRAFSRFVRAVPLTLVYEMEEAFRVPVRMTEIAKSELITGGAGLDCEVAFTATGQFYKNVSGYSGTLSIGGKIYPYEYTYAYADVTQNTLMIDSDSRGDSPCKVEQFICDRIKEMFITNEDGMQNIKGLSVMAATATKDWSLHITPSDKGGHYNIVNLIDSVVIPAMEKYSILVKTRLDIQNREVQITVGKAAAGIITIESDLPNIIKKSVTIKQVSADVNKLVIYDSSDYEKKRVYYLHPDLGYDTKDRDRITPVVCEMQAVSHEEGSSFESAAISAAHNKFANLSYSNLIELTMLNGDALVKPEELEFGQVADIISDGESYRSILTGRERGKNTKLVFGTVRLDLTKILRRQENG